MVFYMRYFRTWFNKFIMFCSHLTHEMTSSNAHNGTKPLFHYAPNDLKAISRHTTDKIAIVLENNDGRQIRSALNFKDTKVPARKIKC